MITTGNKSNIPPKRKNVESSPFLNKVKNISWKISRFILLFGMSYVIVYPLLYMVFRSFCSIDDIYDVTVKWIPKNFTFENFIRVYKGINYPGVFLNSVLVSFGSSLLLLLPCSFAAYGLSRFKFRGRGIVFAFVLMTIVVPQQFFVLPSFLNFSYFNGFGIVPLINNLASTQIRINLLDSFQVFWVPALFGSGIRSGLYIYIFVQFFKALPKELEEASYVDGCGFTNTFFRIIVPSAIPVIVTVFLFSLVWHWNDYQLSSVLMPENRTISSTVVNLKNILYQSDRTSGIESMIDIGQILLDTQVANIFLVSPMVILYLVAQKFFTESIERTGLVG